jgi:arylsulfatase A-like enzyme
MVHSLDESVGRLLAKLDELGIADRTAVIFCSDNGGFINDYQRQPVTSNAPLRSGKGSLYEGGIRIPFIIRAPGAVAGKTCAEPVFTCDLYATCLELAGAKGNAEHDGLSLLPLLSDPRVQLGRDALYFHYPHFYQTTTPVSAVRRGPWKLLHYYDDGHDELFDLSSDLAEQTDLAARQPARAAELRGKLDGWLQAVDARLPDRTASGR